jgi:hypothetical protein
MEDYEEYNDDYNENVENMFGDERNVYERVGMRGDINVDIDMIGMEKKKSQKTPLERFIESVNAITLQIINEKNMLSQGDLKIILETITSLNKPEYKNPTGYVLGYMASNGGFNMVGEKIFDIFDLLEFLEDKSVKPEDVIRYARLWLKIKDNLN